MNKFSTRTYINELNKIKRQLEALQPAAAALDLSQSLNRMIGAIIDGRIDAIAK